MEQKSPTPPRTKCPSKLLDVLVILCCTLGFLWGSAKSWLKYQSEPLTAVSEEVSTADTPMASLTVCPYNKDLFGIDNSLWTMDEAVEHVGMDLVSVLQG